MSSLPSFQGGWLRAVIGDEAPTEVRSTCHDCAMCRDEPLLEESARFRPDLKCCTYLPRVPNFSLGALFADPDPAYEEGRARVRARIAERLGVTPLGIGPTRAWTDRYDQAKGDLGFGRDPALRCPYLTDEGGGRCSVWAHRNAVCATFYCRTDRAVEGQRFWAHARDLLLHVEAELSLWAAVEAGLSPEALDALIGDEGQLLRIARGEVRVHTDHEGRLREADARRLWGRHYDNQEGFFRACGALVASQSWDDVRARLGVPLRALEHRTRRAFDAMRREGVPSRLRRAVTEVDALDEGSVRVSTWYAPRDPVRLDARTVGALDAFDGRPTGEVVAEIRARQGVSLDDAALRHLVDRGVLVAPDDYDTPAIEWARPVVSDDALSVFRWFRGEEVTGALEVADDGRTVFMLRVGPKEVSFADPSLFDFARTLVARHNGFVAREAASWGPPGRPIGWTRAQPLLDELVQQSVLQRPR